MAGLPLHQKRSLIVVVLIGVLLLFIYRLELIDISTVPYLFLFYGMGIPVYMLFSNRFLADLANLTIFRAWCIVAAGFILVYIIYRNDATMVIRDNTLDTGINRWISGNAVSSFRSLPAFLITYWIINTVRKRSTDTSIVSTYKLHKWYSEDGKRKVDEGDVMINILFYIVIFCSSLIELPR